MNLDQQISFLAVMCAVLAVGLAGAIALALHAIIEARRWRLLAIARDPLLDVNAEEAVPPYVRGLVDRLRKMGAL